MQTQPVLAVFVRDVRPGDELMSRHKLEENLPRCRVTAVATLSVTIASTTVNWFCSPKIWTVSGKHSTGWALQASGVRDRLLLYCKNHAGWMKISAWRTPVTAPKWRDSMQQIELRRMSECWNHATLKIQIADTMIHDYHITVADTEGTIQHRGNIYHRKMWKNHWWMATVIDVDGSWNIEGKSPYRDSIDGHGGGTGERQDNTALT